MKGKKENVDLSTCIGATCSLKILRRFIFLKRVVETMFIDTAHRIYKLFGWTVFSRFANGYAECVSPIVYIGRVLGGIWLFLPDRCRRARGRA